MKEKELAEILICQMEDKICSLTDIDTFDKLMIMVANNLQEKYLKCESKLIENQDG